MKQEKNMGLNPTSSIAIDELDIYEDYNFDSNDPKYKNMGDVMKQQNNMGLKFSGPISKNDFDIYEARNFDSSNPKDWRYSCVAIYKGAWRNGWPALGGTRCVTQNLPTIKANTKNIRQTTTELAMAMHIKNTVLRHSEEALIEDGTFSQNRPKIFGWQGGKGVIWVPADKNGLAQPTLNPDRLMCHGELLNYIGRIYLASKDQGIGASELKWISTSSQYVIGLDTPVDTGEATAYGVFAGLSQAISHLKEIQDTTANGELTLKGAKILIVGAGKVGLPLAKLLHDNQVDVYMYDPDLLDGRKMVNEAAIKAKYNRLKGNGAAITEDHLAVLKMLFRQHKIFQTELEALSSPDIEILSVNGGNVKWLSESLEGTDFNRAEFLKKTRLNGGRLRLSLGAANDQLSVTSSGEASRISVLQTLTDADILFVPDALVSPGGVIAVSHEKSSERNSTQVNAETQEIVRKNVDILFKLASSQGDINAQSLYQAFERMIHTKWT